jgi:hypothetical protein
MFIVLRVGKFDYMFEFVADAVVVDVSGAGVFVLVS